MCNESHEVIDFDPNFTAESFREIRMKYEMLYCKPVFLYRMEQTHLGSMNRFKRILITTMTREKALDKVNTWNFSDNWKYVLGYEL